MKEVIDDELFRNINLLENEPMFEKDVLYKVANVLRDNNIQLSSNDRNYISGLISKEYLGQR